MRFPQDRGRLVAVLTSVACVVAVVLGATVATSTLAPAVAFAQTGHWVVNTAESAVVHVDGGTQQVDARVELPADIGEPLFAVQGERQGFVVAADRIAVFGRSSLTVDSTIPVEFAETPVGIETLGGPYLVYREAGTIVRLGVPPLSLPVGGRVERPVWTDDGTVWLHRPDNGSFCALRNGADALDCSVGAPGEPGGLSVTGELPAFVGSRQDAAQVIAASLGSPVGLGTDVVDAALLADRDTEGRLAVVEPATNRLVLIDSGGVPDGRDGGAPVVVDLGPGTFTSPVAADGIVALLDTAASRLLTYDVTGRLIATTDLPPGTDATDLIRGGDGRIYVDDADGSATHIVGADGTVTSVGTGGASPELVAVAAPPSRMSPISPPPSRFRPSSPGFAVVGAPRAPGLPNVPGVTVDPSRIGLPMVGPNPGPAPPQLPPPPPPPIGPAAAPTAIAFQEHPNEVPTYTVSWRAPALNGGHLAYYEFSASDYAGVEVITATPAVAEQYLLTAACALPVTVQVRAVTTDPATGRAVKGDPATATTGGDNANCTLSGRISASTSNETSVGITLDIDADYPYSRGTCVLSLDGVERWRDGCGVEEYGASRDVTIDGLNPATEYSAQLTITSENGRTTRSNVVSVATLTPLPVDEPDPVPTERPSDINGDGQVGCLDKAILDAQWGQTGPDLSADLNVDQTVDITDLSKMLSDWTGDSEQGCDQNGNDDE